MLTNKLNQIYKPNRILFYKEASDEDIQAFYKGETDSDVFKYSNDFGTYDYPGLFYVDSLHKPVIGIEFRANDSGIDYPNKLSDRYNMESLDEDVIEVYNTIGKKIGAFKNGEADFNRVSEAIINDIKSERIKEITFDRYK